MAATITRLPGPKSFPGLGNFLRFRKDPPAFLLELARRYGDVVPYRVAGVRLVLLSNPDDIRTVLVTQEAKFRKGRALRSLRLLLGNGLLTSEGAFHLRQRRLLQPAFSRSRVAAHAAVMAECASRRAETWNAGSVLDLHHEMSGLALEIAVKTLFGADIGEDQRSVYEALLQSQDAFDYLMYPMSGLLMRLPFPATRRFWNSRRRLDEIIYRIIGQHRREGVTGNDFLSILLSVREEESGEGMKDEQARDEAMTIFLAGHETTANALTWSWHLLGSNPEAEARLHAELDSVPAEKIPEAILSDSLPYTRGVFAETMRLYPPAWAIGRHAVEECPIAGAVIPKNYTVVMSPYVVHRDPRYFHDPESFRPERWLEKRETPRFAYFPFGGGPRLCIGESFAWLEGGIALALLARRWRFRPCAETRAALLPRVTLRPRYGLKMLCERRSILMRR